MTFGYFIQHLTMEALKKAAVLNMATLNHWVFFLHSRVTVIVLVVFALMIFFKQYLLDPIDCNVSGVPKDTMNAYCWAHSTYSVHEEQGSSSALHPGVVQEGKDSNKRHHKYYQWVDYCLLVQAAMFYVPHFLWMAFESGRMNTMIYDFKYNFLNLEKVASTRRTLAIYFVHNMNEHSFYASKYFMYQVLNFVNVVGQIFLIDKFVQGQFTTFGADVVSSFDKDPEDRDDPLEKVFPIVTKCLFKEYTRTGDAISYTSMCILKLNCLNQKIYVFLWFWLVVLSVMTGCVLAWCFIISVNRKFRMLNLKMCSGYLKDIDRFGKKCNFGDWFLIGLFAKNIDPINFRELISEISKTFAENEALSGT